MVFCSLSHQSWQTETITKSKHLNPAFSALPSSPSPPPPPTHTHTRTFQPSPSHPFCLLCLPGIPPVSLTTTTRWFLTTPARCTMRTTSVPFPSVLAPTSAGYVAGSLGASDRRFLPYSYNHPGGFFLVAKILGGMFGDSFSACALKKINYY